MGHSPGMFRNESTDSSWAEQTRRGGSVLTKENIDMIDGYCVLSSENAN